MVAVVVIAVIAAIAAIGVVAAIVVIAVTKSRHATRDSPPISFQTCLGQAATLAPHWLLATTIGWSLYWTFSSSAA